MTTKEAIQAMLDGKKVRRLNWPKSIYLYFDENEIKTQTEIVCSNIVMVPAENWEIYEEKEQ